MSKIALSFLFCCLSLQAFGQVDSSSELLLGNGNSESASNGLESGRYKKTAPRKLASEKVANTLPKKKSVSRSNDSEEQLDSSVPVVATKVDEPIKAKVKSDKTANGNPSEMAKVLFAPTETAKPVIAANESKSAPVAEVEEPTVTEQMRDLVSGNQQPAIEAYKEQIHPDDIRMNRIEINIKPGILSNSSKSSYSYRSYNSFSPKVLLGAQFWMTPFLGIYGDYTTTLGGDIPGDAASRSRVTAQSEWTELGLDIRKFFGMSRKSNSVEFGIHFSEYKFSVPGDEVTRMKLKSSGFGVHVLNRIPVAPSYSWVIGSKFMPRIQHSELQTGIDATSGSTGESNRIELIVGGELKMSRQNQMVWDVTTAFEKNQFGGQATAVDPETGTRPKGVSVENTFILVSFGYRWGQ